MHRPRRSTARSALVLAAAVAIGLPAAWPAAAAPAETTSLPLAALSGGNLASGGSDTADASPSLVTDAAGGADASAIDPGSSGGSVGEAGQTGPLEPSAQYLDSLAHARDRIDFQPGARVSVPFQPRAGDGWSVDGAFAKPLPAGSLSGAQMRAATPSDPGAPAAPTTASADTDVSATAWLPEAQAAAAVSPTGLHRAVFGFLPYWEVGDSDTTLDFSTLSTIAYFSVGCAPGGNLLKRNPDGTTSTGWAGWTSSKMTSVINAAHSAGTRVDLTVSCFAWSSSGATLQATILNSSAYRTTLAKQTAKAVHDRGADGVNLDFEPLVSGTEAGFVAFIRALRSALDAYAHGYELTFDTMGFVGNYPIESATASGAADAVMIMGYDYRTAGSSSAGSISPLTGPSYDLNDTISAYTSRIPASKVILGLPYYGRAWSTDSSGVDAKNISGTRYGASVAVTYASAIGFAASYGRHWDPIEQAPWVTYKKQTCTATYGCVTSWRELYYDDVQSLAARYDMINRRGLRGAGIWALGYDSTRPELRQLLANKFLRDTTPPLTGIVDLAPTQVDQGFRVSWKAYDDSGVASYDVQVSRDGGTWAAWLTGTTGTSDVFLAANGHTYAFRVRATDKVGNASAWTNASVSSLSAPASLAGGTFGRVTIDGLHMRASPDTSATAMATLAKGATLYITGGPRTGDGYTWYRVNGPVGQWTPVDFMQLGGWVAVSDGTTRYVVPTAVPYATRVAAGLIGYAVGGGSQRVVTPNGDGVDDTVRLDWTNTVALDSLTLRVFAADGSLVGTRAVYKLAAGPQSASWDGTLGGSPVATGAYVLQLVGTRGTTTYTTPSATPVTPAQILRFGVAVGPAAPTSVARFVATTPAPTRSGTISYQLVFGGSVTGLAASDFSRTGTATGCVVGAPTGSGSTYAVTVSSCSVGTVGLAVKAKAVRDAVGNTGPASAVAAPTVLIDRSAPTTGVPSTGLQSSVVFSTSATSARLAWSASDPGGAGIASYDVERSVDGAAFGVIKTGLTTASLAVTLPAGHTYRFAVRAHDRAGNVGVWKAGSTTSLLVRQDSSSSLAWSAGWHSQSATSYLGGTVRYATTAGASVAFTFIGRSVALITTLAANRGQIKVYVDGSYVATVDCGTPTTVYQRVAWSRTWGVAGTHTVRLVVVGTAGRPRVDLDALAVLR